MYSVREVTDQLYWIGANDNRLHLFENIHPIPKGVSYNSYVLLDEKTVLFDTADWAVCRQFLENLEHVLNGRTLDYVVINHMEPDHAASLEEVLIRYPDVTIISTAKAFTMMKQYNFVLADKHEQIVVKEGDTQSFGTHEVTFIMAPMVHWPEVMMTLDLTNGALFSADAFGSFISLGGKLFADEVNYDRDWLDEARRYYTNIVGKYGKNVQAVLKKAGKVLDKIKFICPLHGLVWRQDFDYLLDKYDHWSKYEPEDKAVMIAYASMYENTESVAFALAAKLVEKGLKNVVVYDVSNTHVSHLISETFRVSHIVLASVTYNLGIYPVMLDYLEHMNALAVQNRTFAIIENGTWAIKSGDLMKQFIETNLKNSTVLEPKITITSAADSSQDADLDKMADALIASVNA